MLSMLTGGGPLPIPRIPCALCLGERPGAIALDGSALDAEPVQAATLVRGTLVCAEHAGELLGTFDHGHVAAGLADVAAALALLADRVDRLGQQ